MKALQKAALARRAEGEGILEFGSRVWIDLGGEGYRHLEIVAWQRRQFCGRRTRGAGAEQRRAIIHKDTGANQAKNFREVADDTLFYLCYGNEVRLLGQLQRARQGFGQRGGLA